MGFVHETIHSVSIELKKENDKLKQELAETQVDTKKTPAGKKNTKKKNS
jgi:hypothetical protein